MENITLHILIELLTPFLIFLIAEHFDVSPVLAVFTSGVIHSFARGKINPENVNLNNASDSVWDVFGRTCIFTSWDTSSKHHKHDVAGFIFNKQL